MVDLESLCYIDFQLTTKNKVLSTAEFSQIKDGSFPTNGRPVFGPFTVLYSSNSRQRRGSILSASDSSLLQGHERRAIRMKLNRM